MFIVPYLFEYNKISNRYAKTVDTCLNREIKSKKNKIEYTLQENETMSVCMYLLVGNIQFSSKRLPKLSPFFWSSKLGQPSTGNNTIY